MLRFKDILLGSPLPLHPSLLEYQRLSIEITGDGEALGRTEAVNVNALESGIWEIPSSLEVAETYQWFTLIVVAHKGRIKIRLASATENVEKLTSGLESQPDAHYDFPIGNSDPFQFLMTYSVERTGVSISDTPRSLPSTHNFAKFSRQQGGALIVRFINGRDFEDLEKAIQHLQNGLAVTDPGDPERPGILCGLGLAHMERFEGIGDLPDIEEAISCLREAVETSSLLVRQRALGFLGSALRMRFKHLGSLVDLGDAISSLRKAVELTPDDHPDKPSLLSDLGNALKTGFQHLGSMIDIEDAILSLRRAVELTPDVHRDKPSQLSNLGNALQIRFGHCGSIVDIEDAISSLRKAVELTPDGHPDKPGRLSNLGRAHIHHFKHFGSIEHLEMALQSYSTAASSITGPASIRFDAAHLWAITARDNSRSPLPAFNRAIELLPQVAWLGLAISDQHALLADIGGIVRGAVAAAIEWEEYENAVEWADQGRSIVWQNMLGLRTPLDKLRSTHEHLANRLQDIAQKMETPTSDGVSDATQTSLRLAAEWDHTIEEIRHLPGFETFLKPKKFTQLAPAAQEGPVVILNISESRCDALVLVADNSSEKQASVFNIPLTHFSYEKSQKLGERLAGLLTLAGVRARGDTRKTRIVGLGTGSEDSFESILRILWVGVVKPVIERLAYQIEPEKLPRIWWCATGPLAFLPIHAAGIYGTGAGEKLSDYVVSSYTPTLTAILDTSPPITSHDFKLLTVAQPSTPYATSIPGTKAEIEQVEAIAGIGRTVNLTSEHATVARVLQEMRATDWVHLACHGQQCTGDPMRSGLLLHDKILELSEIVKLALTRADFAFLSACQTATGDEKVADESVHLAAGMFMAGYRSVIATMWSINDNDAPRIASDVYQRILKDGRPNRKEAAHALHDAVKRLRESGAPFVAWVPFIHIGR